MEPFRFNIRPISKAFSQADIEVAKASPACSKYCINMMFKTRLTNTMELAIFTGVRCHTVQKNLVAEPLLLRKLEVLAHNRTMLLLLHRRMSLRMHPARIKLL